MSKKLGTLIKNGRTEKGLTQAQLAAKVKGLTASDISKAERGLSEPTKEQLREIAKVLGVTQTSLLNAAGGTSAAKTSSAKTGSGKKSSGKTSSGKTSSSSTAFKLSAEEKKLVKLYRAADKSKRAMAMMFLGGDPASSTGGVGSLLSSSSINSLMGNALSLFGKKELEAGSADGPDDTDGDVVIEEYGQ